MKHIISDTAMSYTKYLSPIEEIIADAAEGKLFVLVDDEERENEGDLIIPAEKCTADAVNFMAKYGRGLICLTLEQSRIEALNLPLMAQHNNSRHQTAFTISIEARVGVTTGISAADRAHTIATAIDPSKGEKDIASPGHVFPLAARDGGVLVRAGHTEASVDIARMAGLNPSAVICEIMKDDGTMARLPDLVTFADAHNIKIATIAALIAYRRKHETLVMREMETSFVSTYGGEFTMIVYVSTVEYAEHIVLIKGDINTGNPVWVRMHSSDILSDALGDTYGNKQDELHRSMEKIAEHGSGVIVIMRTPKRNHLTNSLRNRVDETDTPSANLRDYGLGAQILLDLGIKDMVLLSNSERSIIGLEGYGLTVSDRIGI